MTNPILRQIQAAALCAALTLAAAASLAAQEKGLRSRPADSAAAASSDRGPMIDLVRLGHSIGLVPPWDEVPAHAVLLLHARLDSTGHVDTVYGAPGGTEFLPATAQALPKTVLQPARRDGRPVACIVTLRVEFERRMRQGTPLWVPRATVLGWKPGTDRRAWELSDDRFKPFAGRLSAPPRFDTAQVAAHIRYPAAARGKQVEGVVNVIVDVRADGIVDDVAIASSDSALLDDAAIEAVLETPFTAAVFNGTPVAAPVTVPVVFKPQ
ncbi:MAG TPA: energy transducer TonB [Candidatus Kapabacteria bacterium]|nr:energy transducer TonB [Candidatus Kapabacteria bacterium]